MIFRLANVVIISNKLARERERRENFQLLGIEQRESRFTGRSRSRDRITLLLKKELSSIVRQSMSMSRAGSREGMPYDCVPRNLDFT